MTEATLAAGFADELTPEDQAILNGGTPPVPEPPSGDTPATDKTATSADSPPKPQDAKPEAPDLSNEDGDDEESVEVENKGRFVRHGAFHAERQRRKALERELADFRDKYTRGDERLRLLNEALSAKPAVEQQKPAEPPDPEKDIFAYLKWQAEQINEVRGQLTQTGQKIETADAETQLKSAYVSDAQRFASQNNDFGDAYAFLMNGRMAELEASGITDPQERMQVIVNEEKWLVQRALQSQSSPAERLYALAKARGYKKAETPAQNGNGATVQPTNGAADKIAAIAKAKPATESLSNVGGSPGSDALTMEALASMSEEEYASIRSKLSPAKFAQIMTG